jgi:hypothetical protein
MIPIRELIFNGTIKEIIINILARISKPANIATKGFSRNISNISSFLINSEKKNKKISKLIRDRRIQVRKQTITLIYLNPLVSIMQ